MGQDVLQYVFRGPKVLLSCGAAQPEESPKNRILLDHMPQEIKDKTPKP